MSQEIHVTGRLGGEPEIRDVNGTKVCSFSVASDRYGGKDKPKITEWFKANIWNREKGKEGTADAAAKILKTGSAVSIKGLVKPNAYMANGEAKATIEIRVREWECLGNSRPQSTSPATTETPTEEDIPF